MKRTEKTITQEEHEDLFYKVENEGFGYYMTAYGPDIDAICKLGFDRDEIVDCIKLMDAIQSAIDDIEIDED